MLRTAILSLGAFLALFQSGAISMAQEAPRKPNVIYILADDLGYTDLACFGSRYHETPNLDRLARDGIRMTDAYTCGPNCQPTRAALMSGQYGPRTGIYTVGSIGRFDWRSRPLRPVDNVTEMPLDRILLPQALKANGYATGMFGKWHLGEQGERHPAKRGFDEAVVTMGKHFDFETSPPQQVPPGVYLADYLTDRAVDFIQRHKSEPFFLYLPHFGVHVPHQAKPELIKHFQAKPTAGGHNDHVYAAMIYSVDESVGRIRKAVEDLGLAEKTLIIFTSDNGGVGGYVREGIKPGKEPTDNLPLRGGKGMLYEGGIRVPFIARWPGVITPGTQSDEPIISVDLLPTVLEATGTSSPPNQVRDGSSYLGALKGDPPGFAPRTVYWHFPGYLGASENTWRTTPAAAVRRGDWKLIEFFEDDRYELYNLRNDLSEKNNLADREPKQVEALKKLMYDWRAEVKAPMPTANTNRQPPRATRGGD